ncbi:MAG: OPT family oligopeptide transporter [Pseudomonadota bacterium]
MTSTKTQFLSDENPQSHADRQSVSRPELTVRSICSGMLIGAILTPCNVYAGLKIGWGFNMSVAAGLLAYGFWTLSANIMGTRSWGLFENNINQTTASASSAIISAGLVAPIPALALLTGQEMVWYVLSLWLFVVSFLGVVVAAGLRNQMLMRENLRFPSGIVTAETMRDIHSGWRQAASRLRVLFASICVSGIAKLYSELVQKIPRISPELKFTFNGNTANAGTGSVSFANLGLSLDPSLLMIGLGAIAGLRVGISAALGALLAWVVLAPLALEYGWVLPGPNDPNVPWFKPLVEWLLWPGATLMLVASLTSFAISMVQLYGKRQQKKAYDALPIHQDMQPVFSSRMLFFGLCVALVLLCCAQVLIFEIDLAFAVLAVLLSYVLAVVAARISGETGITPVGALGKITQFTYGILAPGNLTANLMTANVTGGAAGQCADLLHDLRTGQIIGATPKFQIIAQVFGILTGSLVGALTYLVLIPNPQEMLITAEWPAPAVVTWKAVAEVLSAGLATMPQAALPAMAIAAGAGMVLAIIEKSVDEKYAVWVPSAPSIGFGFVLPAWNLFSLFLGAALAYGLTKLYPEWSKRKLIVLAAGLIVGESLAGVFVIIVTFAGG